MTRRILAVLLLLGLAFGCNKREDLGQGWFVVVTPTMTIDSGIPKVRLFKGVNGRDVQVDSVLTAWYAYGECVAYTTSRNGESTYLAGDDRAPIFIGVNWEETPDGLVKRQLQRGKSSTVTIPRAAFHQLTMDRPRLTESWLAAVSESDENRMMNDAEGAAVVMEESRTNTRPAK